jgi:endoglucanase
MSEGPYVIEVDTGSAGPALNSAGYRMVTALARCAALGQSVDADLMSARDVLYFPSTLRMLSLAIIRERFPQCL